MKHELHPLCTLFPRMEGAEFASLVEDIRANGLRQPIVLHRGMVLDGGNRVRACEAAGVQPAFVEFDGDNIAAFVLSANLHRRHMTAGQQAAIVASAQDWMRAHSRGGDRRSDQSATLHFDRAEERAAIAGASVRTQKMADEVARKAPDLARKVARGEMSLPDAVRQVQPPRQPDPEDAPGDADRPDAAELLEDLQRDVERLTRENKALTAADGKAELVKQIGIKEHLQRQVNDEMAKNKTLADQRDFYAKQLRRCGRAVGQEDLDKVAPAVEAFVRQHQPRKAA